MKVKRFFAVSAFILALVACTEFKVVDVDPKTGSFPTRESATVLVDRPLDIDARKSLLLIPAGEFTQGLVQRIGYFDEVMTEEDLERKIIAANLGEKIPTVRDLLGLNKAATIYQKFLWLHYEQKGQMRETRYQLVLSDPITMTDYFVVETDIDPLLMNFNDQHNWYPMFNQLIDYIRKNSKSYKKQI